MLPEIIRPDLTVIFVGAAVTELSESLGFYHLHPKDRFWELLAIGSITPKYVITAQERKAHAEDEAELGRRALAIRQANEQWAQTAALLA